MKFYTFMFIALTSFGAIAQNAETAESSCHDKAVKTECKSESSDKKCCAKDGDAAKKECKKGEAADKKCCKKDGDAAKKECKKGEAADKKCCKKDGDAAKKECKTGEAAVKMSCHGVAGVEKRMEVRVEVNNGDTTVTVNGEPHDGDMHEMHWIPAPPPPSKPMLGVALNAEAADAGATISEVIPGSTAQVMGLQAEDVIYKVNKTSVSNHTEAIAAVGSHDASTAIVIHYRRGGKKAKAQGFLIAPGGGHPNMKIHHLKSPEGGEKRIIIKKMVQDDE